jgi:fluoroquinolone transport system permease protein
MISPVTENEYLMSKLIVNVLNSMITVVFISGAVYLVKGVTYNYLLLVPAVIIVTVVHSLIGIWFSYGAKDFTSLLVNFIVYAFIFLMPSVFAALGIISSNIAKYLILMPPEASSILIGAGFEHTELWKLLFGYVYLAVLAVLLYRFAIKPKFNEYLMKETGV